MKYIVYVSQAAQPFSKEDLAGLLEHSRTRNEADGITGLLIYRYNPEFERGNFLQVLEGPDAELDDVWNRIACDSRHHTIVVLEDGPCDTRAFGNWSMGFRNVDESDFEDFPGFAQLGTDAFWETASAHTLPDALDAMRSFYDGA